MAEYEKFLEDKQQLIGDFGFDPDWFPQVAFGFQNHIIEKSVRKGRYGVFADTGLGKTIIQLAIANNIIRHTNGNVLILTPLAVAFQFLDDAEKIGIDDIHHSKDGAINKKITICNYERLHYLSPHDFVGVICDESSILKNFKGQTKDKIIQFVRKIKYRFLSTATPSPNDFIELGNSSEALGHMGYMDMLGRFFRNNQNSTNSNNRNIGEKYYLKPHAERDFFAWVNQWSIMVKKPSDIGFSDDGYILPELITNTITVKNEKAFCVDGQASLFVVPAKNMGEIREEQKNTVVGRCEKAVSISEGKTSVYWCNRNDESDLLKNLDNDAVEIRGSMDIERKESILLDFAKGNIERLITKPSITSMGLNWQHCNHTCYFPTWSYEQYYQSIRRFWRFGQKRPVKCNLIISEGQGRVLEAIEQKTQKSIDLYQNLVANVNQDFVYENERSKMKITLPEFIK